MFRIKFIYQISYKTFQRPFIFHNVTPCISMSNFVKTNQNKFLTSNIHADADRTEQELFVKLKNDPDVFGTSTQEVDLMDDGDLKELKHFEDQVAPGQRLSTKKYADHIKSLIQKRKIKEALDYVEVKMIKEDRVKPENYIYNLLLGACGRVGYTKKAFSLYNQMKKRGLAVSGGTYTALFNACANSPWPEDGLTRARHLRELMIEKLYEPNDTNYNAMIKAFGRCGDLPTTFNLVDEMIAKKLRIRNDTINFLLHACISDKDVGFRHALLVWRKMINKGIKPNLYTYNLMLRCIRDCGLGDSEVTTNIFDEIFSKEQLLNGNYMKLLPEQSNIDGSNLTTLDNKDSALIINEYGPNLMANVPHLGNLIALSEITKAEDRLLLVGGLKGFLDNMENSKVIPDIKTCTQLLDCLPGNLASERDLMAIMKKLKITPDLDFYNMLIKKRSMRFDYEGGKDVLHLIKTCNYRPNLITYGVLALGCRTREDALELLNEMKEHSYRLNTEILGTMLRQACSNKNFTYVLEIMELSLRENIPPNQMYLKCLADFKRSCKQILYDEDSQLGRTASFQKGLKIFLMRYKTWLTEIEIENEDVHPWQQFRQNTETDVKYYKDKSVRFKPKHTSLFKVKTSTRNNKR